MHRTPPARNSPRPPAAERPYGITDLPGTTVSCAKSALTVADDPSQSGLSGREAIRLVRRSRLGPGRRRPVSRRRQALRFATAGAFNRNSLPHDATKAGGNSISHLTALILSLANVSGGIGIEVGPSSPMISMYSSSTPKTYVGRGSLSVYVRRTTSNSVSGSRSSSVSSGIPETNASIVGSSGAVANRPSVSSVYK